MTRLFVEPHNWKTGDIGLPREEAHRLLHVLRASRGQVVTIFDGRGREASARLETGERGGAVLHVLEEHTCPPPPVRTILIQAIPKGSRMDLVVEKATEMGVSAIMPVITARTVVRPGERERGKKLERWKRISLSAVKQCGTPHIPEIMPVRDLDDVLRNPPPLDLFLVATLEVKTAELPEVLRGADKAGIRAVACLIGPEGDLAPDEVASAVAAGAVPVSLGRTVLRSETAAIYALSVLRYELG